MVDIMQIAFVALAIVVIIGVLMIGSAFVTLTYNAVNGTAPSTGLDNMLTAANSMLATTANLSQLVVVVALLVVVLALLFGIFGGHRE